MKKILLFIGLYIVMYSVNADGANAGTTNTGTMDLHYVSTILSDAASWQTPVLKASIQIFTILWFFDTFREGLFHQLFQVGKLQELLRFVIVRVIFFGFFSSIFLYPEFYLGIVKYLGGVGRTQLHFATDSTGGSGNVTGLDAGWIWKQYTAWFANDYTPAILKKGLSELGTQLSMAIGSIVYLLCTCWISFLIIMLEVQAKATLFGGLILTSCAASKWTESWWNSYLGAVVSLGIKVMMFMFLYASIQAEMSYKSGHTITGSIDVWNQIINTIICTFIITVIPSKIAGMVSSAGASDLGGKVVAGALAGMAIAAKAGKMASKGAKSAGGKSKSTSSDLNKSKPSSSDSNKSTPSGGDKSQQPMADKGDKSEFMKGNKADGKN